MITLKEDPRYLAAQAKYGTDDDPQDLRAYAALEVSQADVTYSRHQYLVESVKEVGSHDDVRRALDNLEAAAEVLENKIHAYRLLGGARGCQTFEGVCIAAFIDKAVKVSILTHTKGNRS